MELAGSSALVVGGAGGFGSATVRRLVKAGVKVIVADMAEDAGRALVGELGDVARFVRTDVTDDDSVKAAVSAATELGPLRTVVVTHGGPAVGKRIVSRDGKAYPAAGFARTVDIFLTGTYRVLGAAAETMAANDALDSGQRGVIVTTASIAGYESQPGQSDYAAAKGGVISLNLAAARDLAPLGIRVVGIAPGTFFTPAYGLPEEEAQERFGKGIPNPKRMGRADEYAQLAMSIAENDYINGEVIRIDAGLRFTS